MSPQLATSSGSTFAEIAGSNSRVKHYAEIKGWIYNDECAALQNLAAGKDCLEIGSFMGKSTVAMAETARRIRAVDTFHSDPAGESQVESVTTLKSFLDNIAGYRNITTHPGSSADVVPTFRDDEFDLIFIDGDHTAEGLTTDIRVCWPKLKPGGVMAFHDYGFHKWPAVKRIVDFLFRLDGVVRCLAWTTK